MPELPVISFDLDGVLIQNPFQKGVGPRIGAHIRESAALAGLEPAEADERINKAVRQAWGARMARGDFVTAYDWDDIYSEVSRNFGGSPVPDVAAIVAECCEQEGMIALLPQARESLEALTRAGFRLVAATNGYHAYQWPVLEALGIAEFFGAVLSPDLAGYAKPEPGFFESVPGLVAHVGDTLVHDVLGANLAGIASVWLADDLPEALKTLGPGERVKQAQFTTFLEGALSRTLYREYHPEATLQSCTPQAVIADVSEVLEAVRESLEVAARS